MSLLQTFYCLPAIWLDFLKVLVGCPILGDIFYLYGAKFTGGKFLWQRHDRLLTIGEWVTFHATPDIAYVNHFFLCEFVIFKSIQVKQVDGETLLRALLLCDFI